MTGFGSPTREVIDNEAGEEREQKDRTESREAGQEAKDQAKANCELERRKEGGDQFARSPWQEQIVRHACLGAGAIEELADTGRDEDPAHAYAREKDE